MIAKVADNPKEFFPANKGSFFPVAGDVKVLDAADFEDDHRRRHLDSYAKSSNDWRAAGKQINQKDREEAADAWAEDLLEMNNVTDKKEMDAVFIKLRRKFRTTPPIHEIVRSIHRFYKNDPELPRNRMIESLLVKRAVRGASGVTVITVLTAPGTFSCAFDCAYCPNEPGQPRSYLSTEPAVLRANQNNWDAREQFWDRALTLYDNGHVIDKLEVLVLGGTWSGYPEDYQEEFVRDLFFAANVFPQYIKDPKAPLRPRLSLQVEQAINEAGSQFGDVPRIIGLTLETRPDQITPREIHRLRWLGCTRIQMGIQHTSDHILKKIRRQCSLETAIKALQLLKNACYKVDIHLMPDLPGATPQIDREMFQYILSSPSLQADQWKVYPCEVTPFSSIEKWYTIDKTYKPYTDSDNGRLLVNLLAGVKRSVHPWIRLNRVVRDIPEPTIIGGNNRTNLRQVLSDVMDATEWDCRCMRCREVRDSNKYDPVRDAVLKIRKYNSDGGLEYFISVETLDESVLFGFLRMRICNPVGDGFKNVLLNDDMYNAYKSKNDPCSRVGVSFMDTQGQGGGLNGQSERNDHVRKVNKLKKSEQQTFQENEVDMHVFPELGPNIARIRELHVYGMTAGVTETKNDSVDKHQHKGHGQKLLAVAERLAWEHKCKGLAVIAGVGVRNYYRKRCGYEYSCLEPPIKAFVLPEGPLQAESIIVPESRVLGSFLMKFTPELDELNECKEVLNLPEVLQIQEYDLTTKIPDLDSFDLEEFTKGVIQWRKGLKNIQKAAKKGKISASRSSKIQETKAHEKPEILLPTSTISHTRKVVDILWTPKDRYFTTGKILTTSALACSLAFALWYVTKSKRKIK